MSLERMFEMRHHAGNSRKYLAFCHARSARRDRMVPIPPERGSAARKGHTAYITAP